MDRAEKEAWVASLHQTLSDTGVVIVTHYSGLSVAEMGDLRSQMRAVGVGLKVTKNRLAKRAAEDTPFVGLQDMFTGPTAIAFSADPVAAAKAAIAFAKTNEKLVILGGGLGEQMLDADGVKALARLPSLDELRGKIVGMLNTPATRLAQVLSAPAGQVVSVTKAYGETGEAA